MTSPRQSGRTTRRIDNAIQHLFKSGCAYLKDHSRAQHANQVMLEKLRKRLSLEHPKVEVEAERITDKFIYITLKTK